MVGGDKGLGQVCAEAGHGLRVVVARGGEGHVLGGEVCISYMCVYIHYICILYNVYMYIFVHIIYHIM